MATASTTSSRNHRAVQTIRSPELRPLPDLPGARRRELRVGCRGNALPRLLSRLGLQPAGALPRAGREGRARAGGHADPCARTPGTPKRQGQWAKALSERSFGGQAFFCNSGTEANEAAIKLARLHTPREAYKIITFEGGFHGRTLGATAATAQPKYHEGLGPLMAGFDYVPFGDLDAVARKIDAETAAIMIEPIQGEGGINLPPPGFLAGPAQAGRRARPALDLRRSAKPASVAPGGGSPIRISTSRLTS